MQRIFLFVLAFLIGLSLTGSTGFAQAMVAADEPCHGHHMGGHQHGSDKSQPACLQCLCCLANPAVASAPVASASPMTTAIVFYGDVVADRASRSPSPDPDPPRPIF